MIAVLLCAGFATRMYPLTRDFPKPLLPVAGQPVIDYTMQQIVDLPQLDEIHVVSNHRFVAQFSKWVQKWRSDLAAAGIDLIVHDDGAVSNETRRGAAGDLQFVIEQVGETRDAFVSAGDNIYCFSLKPLWEQFVQQRRTHIVTLPETDVEKLRKTGVPVFGTSQRVLRMHEKPYDPPSQWCCPPLYFFNVAVWPLLANYLETTNNPDAPGHFIDYLVQRQPVFAFQLESKRLDIGSVATYAEADRLLSECPLVLTDA